MPTKGKDTSNSSPIEPRTKQFNQHSQLQSLASPPKAIVAIEKNQRTRRLLDFIQKQKSSAKDVRPALGDMAMNEKCYSQPQKTINGHQNGVINGCGCESGRKKAQIEIKTRANDKTAHPFVPSKRIIHHHDYQNLADEMKTASQSITKPSNSSRYDNCTYDSVAHNRAAYKDPNNNRKYNDSEQTKTPPAYRHFGDTNLLRSKGKQSTVQYNETNNNNNFASNLSIASTEPSMAVFDKHQKVNKCPPYPDAKRINANHRQTAHRNDAFPIGSAASYVKTNLTNDTGFTSMDTDAASIVTHKPKPKSKSNNSKSNHFQLPFHCINYNVKNRIKMFDVDPLPYRQHPNNKINEKRYVTPPSSIYCSL